MGIKALVLIAAAMPLSVVAQTANDTETADSVALDEVVISAARVHSTTDGMRYTPSETVKAHTTNAYTLLQRLALPNVKVDVAQRKISIPPTVGTLQIRINGVVATMQDMLALDPKSVRHVDHITNPGARYGNDVNMVIAITTQQAVSGWIFGANVLQTLTARNGDDNIFFRLNRGKSELGIDYGFSWHDLRKGEYTETTDYLMADGSVMNVIRSEHGMRGEVYNNNLRLRYSLADGDRLTLLATLSGVFLNTPKDFAHRKETVGNTVNDIPVNIKDHSSSPVLDLYMNAAIGKRQSITASATATLVSSRYEYQYFSATPYAYTTDGNTSSIAAEAIYENRLKPFTLSAGAQFSQSYVHNEYTGDADAVNSIRTSDSYTFATLKGRIGSLAYNIGTGVSRLYYRQKNESYEYWLLRPQLTLQYTLPWEMSVKYNLIITDRAPRLSYLGDVATQTNSMETNVGNAALKPCRRVEQQVFLTLQKPRFYAHITSLYRRNLHTRMTQTYRLDSDDGTSNFITTQTNDGKIDYLYINGYFRWDIVKDRLSLNGSTALNRCLNYGPDYKHHFTGWNYDAGLSAYLGRFTLTANADNGWAFLEGENRQKNTWTWYGSVAYRAGKVDISLIWQHLFSAHPTLNNADFFNQYVHRTVRYRSGDFGNMLSLNITWSISRGREYKKVERKARPTAVDTGIRRVEKNDK